MIHNMETKMKRKIVKQGNSALTITLPASWTKQLGLKPGDEIEAIQEHHYLKLTAQDTSEHKITLNLEDLNEPLIWTYIIAAYRKGFNEFLIKYNKNQIKTIQKATEALLGMAIIEQNSNSCKIIDLSESPSEKEFNNITRRIFYLIEEISESSLNAIKNKNHQELKNIELQDYNINKLSNFCLRLINKRKFSSVLEYIISELENLGDEYTKLSLDLSEESSLNIKKEILELFNETNQLFIDFHKLYYSYNEKDIVKLAESKNRLNQKINSIKTKSKPESIILFHLSKVVHIITNLGERTILMKLS